MFDDRDIIHIYSRAHAIRDGALIDITALAHEAGFRFPVALTRAVWERCVKVPDGVTGQDDEGRTWDIASVLAAAIRRGADGRAVSFAVHVRTGDRRGTPAATPLVAVCGPGDDGEPCVTVMLPGED